MACHNVIWIWAARLAVIASVLWSMGCQSLLGIEERELDTAELSERGYQGCEPGRGVCTACTSRWHRCICEGWESQPEARLRLECAEEHAPAAIRDDAVARAEAAYEGYRRGLDAGDDETDNDGTDSDETDARGTDPPPDGGTDPFDMICDGNLAGASDACMACICGSCRAEMSACAEDADCALILDCVDQEEQDCSPIAMVGPDSCYRTEYCGAALEAAGGVNSAAHQLFRAGIDCLTANACPCNDEGGGGDACWPDAGCDCQDCWARCACQGRPDGQCFAECSSPDCNPGACDGCTECIETCMCNGRDQFYCTELCSPGDSCALDRGCVCGDCVADCACLGEPIESCEQNCACSPQAGCDCGGDCYDECYCQGNDFDTCERRCNTDPCIVQNGCDCGGNCYDECICQGFPPNSCQTMCVPDPCSIEAGCNCGDCMADCACEDLSTDTCLDRCFPDPCTPENGCSCSGCYEQCSCVGNDTPTCDSQCACTPEGGCNCDDCYSKCYCEGNTPATCDARCTVDLCQPSQACSCPDCFSACVCNGGTETDCTQQCADPCSPDGGCNCGDCDLNCLCNGGTTTSCQTQCTPVPQLDCATYDDCAGCYTCAGSCACEDDTGAPFSQCALQCGVSGCSTGDCNSCQTCQARCECEGGDPYVCMSDCTAMLTCADFSFDGCEACACDKCVSEYRICDETPGCRQLLACMAQMDCTNIQDCYAPGLCQTQIDDLGGLQADSMGLVEALQHCRVENDCPCTRSQLTQPISCGSTQCTAYAPPAPYPVAPACCTGSGAESCGRDVQRVFPQASGCRPIDLPGTVTTQCNSIYPTTYPYNGDEVQGCCRPDGTCGYWDNYVLMGCVGPSLFGDTTTQPSCSP